MKKQHYTLDNSKQSSLYEQLDQKNIQNQQEKQLIQAKQSFSQFLIKLGNNAHIPLSPANVKYSKQILQGHFGAHQISLLVQSRVGKMIKNHKIKKNWCKQDCTILAWILQRLTNGKHIRSPQKLKLLHWQTAASIIPGSTAQQCMFKWLSMKKTKICNKKWTQIQCNILQKIVNQNNLSDWKNISRLLYYQNPQQDKKYRHPKQCRQQWNCYLNPKLKKGSWKIDQDIMLMQQVEKQGKKWSIICKKMVSRTQNSLKNRYNFLIQHKKNKYPNISQQKLKKICLTQLQQLSKTKQKKAITQIPTQIQHKPFQKIIKLQNNDNQQQIKVQQYLTPQQFTIVQYNYQQLTKFLTMNHILIPARIQRNQLISYQNLSEKSLKIKYEQ